MPRSSSQRAELPDVAAVGAPGRLAQRRRGEEAVGCRASVHGRTVRRASVPFPCASVTSRDREARRARRRGGLRRHARRDRGLRRGRRRGDDLEDPPDPLPLRRGRGRHQRGARQRGRGQPRDPRLRHRQGLRLPRRPGRDRDLRAGGARRHLSSSRTGARSSPAARTASSRSARSAPPARRAPSTPPTSPATSSSRCSGSRSASATSRSTRSSSPGSSSRTTAAARASSAGTSCTAG